MTHTVAASRDGAVYAWGCGTDGQLGLTAEPAAADSAARDVASTAGGAGGGGCKQQPRSSLLPVLVEDAALDQEDVVQVGEM
jgi:alpha-tubulin suppressor-like RCC1 family protein